MTNLGFVLPQGMVLSALAHRIKIYTIVNPAQFIYVQFIDMFISYIQQITLNIENGFPL